MDIDMDLGDLDLKNIKSKNLKAKLSLGDLDGENIVSDESIFDMDLGELYLDDIISKGLEAKLNNGDLELKGKLEGITRVELDLGSAEVNTELPMEDYSYNVATEMGNFSVNGNNGVAKSAVNKNSKNVIEGTTSLGDFNLNFGI